MARYGSADVGFVLFGGYDIRGTLTEIDTEREVVLEDTTTLGVADGTWAPVGLKRGAMSQRGFWDDATNSVHDMLVGLAQRIACIGVEGNTFGKKFTGWAGAITTKYRRLASKGALHKAEADYQVTGIVEEGIILHIDQSESADPFTGTGHDDAAGTAQGGSGYLQVNGLTLGGFTNWIGKVRDSVDNVTYTDLITFTAVTAAPAAQRLTVAGVVKRWTRTEGDFTGAGSGQSVRFMMGFVRNT